MIKRKQYVILLAILLSFSNILFAGRLYFQTPDEVIQNCPTKINIIMDTQGEDVNSAGINVLLNDSFVINKFDISSGVFRSYAKPKELTATKKEFKWLEFLRLLWTTSSPNGYQGKWIFATLTITPTSDQLNLEFYNIPWYDGEDSNLAVIQKNNNIIDVLKATPKQQINTVQKECTITKLKKLDLKSIDTNINTEYVIDTIEDSIKVINKNVFDSSQEKNRIKRNFLPISILLLIIIIISITLLTKKKEQK